MDDICLGVDLGGTKTEAVVLRRTGDPSRMPDILARVRIPTCSDEGYERIICGTHELVLEVARDAGLTKLPPIGVGMPGSVSLGTGEALVKNSNTTCLNGRPFRRDLQAALGVPISFANDANCFALAEATFGAAAGARVAFGVILGTGVGGGVVFKDQSGAPRVWNGAQGIAGEWGHVVLDPVSGPACYCGKRGCVETYLSGPALERAYAEKTGTSRALPDIVARTEDPASGAVLDAMIEVFGRALSSVLDVLDPDVVILGGGVANIERLYTDGLEAVRRWVFSDTLETRIVKNALGDSAGVFGAALLADVSQ